MRILLTSCMKKTPLSRAFSPMKNKNNLPITAKVLTLKLFLKNSRTLLIFCHSGTFFLKTITLRARSARIKTRLTRCYYSWKTRRSIRLSSNTEDLIMDGSPKIFTRELTIKIGQSRFSKFLMETALVVSPHSLGMTGEKLTLSVTTTRFSSISPAPANSPPNTLE